ncbi:sphingomyelin phosphodiesterase 5-like isoform X1 [Penaeus japonicus]|uniref:sphingomyelin phosphodiesterase 5-like isoform X1 n=1 Tax=Penaeus japonicus TaxID=27405 RepID=UPI001C70F8A7|nr:sphingomyelin phosphodiesterase 5-like isoform X1 [Penaeus japonicus]XP_042892321.1 sphingomyelin phosphodiesterase 5-like isoform X1 [Penaeus japonicus]XP_042892322.1 sphingomyelin phosphodiesterase 5-like isoform X1 [Penaeus japonicus]
MVPRRSCYDWCLWQGLDFLSSCLTLPFLHLLSLGLSCYYHTTFDSHQLKTVLLRYAVAGPILLLLTIVMIPLAAIGYVIWVALCAFCVKQPFIYVDSDEHQSLDTIQKCPSSFTICSSNVILIPEFLVRINNNRNVYWRAQEIPARFMRHQTPSLNVMKNLREPVKREDIVQSWLPDIDVIMLQEVFERYRGRQLYDKFSKKYPYCIYNAGKHSLKSNLCFMGSGLFIASRFPIMEASFHPFSYSTKYAKYVGYGVLLAKLYLGMKSQKDESLKAVGYVGNTHTQAYQGKDKVIVHQLEEARRWMNQFVSETHNPQEEILMFVVFGGDLNSDNMSPGDSEVQNLPLWEEYEDPCRESAGRDKPWAIGTEHRQKLLHHPLVQYPETFRDILLDDVQRRYFLLDAVVKEHTPDLMKCVPKPDSNGVVGATESGGRRRVDCLMVRRDSKVSPTNMWFSTSLAGLTDHVPVAFMLEET